MQLLRGRRRVHRRRTMLLSWLLEELQIVLQTAIARGVRLAFSEVRDLPHYEGARDFAERAPEFDLRIEGTDDGG